MNRREFLKESLITAGALLIPYEISKEKKLIGNFQKTENQKNQKGEKGIPNEEEKKKEIKKTVLDPLAMYLTFDDAPRGNTQEFAEVLASVGGKGTFFVIGSQINKKTKYQIEKVLEQGHLVGNHSFSHPKFSKISKEKAREEIERTHELIRSSVVSVLGEKSESEYKKVFRFPYGDCGNRERSGGSEEKKEEIQKILSEMGYESVLWDIDTRDWESPRISNEKIWKNFESGVGPGKIVLLHEKENTLTNILPQILETYGSDYTLKTL